MVTETRDFQNLSKRKTLREAIPLKALVTRHWRQLLLCIVLQAGLLFGSAELIERLRRHPAARALRVDKLTLAALEATVLGPPPPLAQALGTDVTQLRARAESLAAALPQALGAEAVDCIAAVGGGGAPGVELPSAAVSLPESCAAALRAGMPPVVGRLEAGRCLLDLRTVAPEDDKLLIAAVRACSS